MKRISMVLLALFLVGVVVVANETKEASETKATDAACSSEAAKDETNQTLELKPGYVWAANNPLPESFGSCNTSCVDFVCAGPDCAMDFGTCTNDDLRVRCCDAGGGQQLRCSGFQTVHVQACACDPVGGGPAICPNEGVTYACQ